VAAYTLRPARDGDWLALYRLHREAMGPHVEATWGPWDERQQWQLFLGRVAAGKMRVVEVAGMMAGLLELSERPDALFVDNIALAPGFRGRGLGSDLLRSVMDAAAARGLGVQLQVLRVNPARRLYERLGFRVTGETGTHYQMAWSPPGGLQADEEPPVV
jgi:ribosomal protein S18 acetylase RimI-like enzyme